MKRVFVESNWVFDFCAPAHKRTPDAERLAERAAKKHLRIHVPAVALTEGLEAIRQKCQPKAAKEIFAFRRWAIAANEIDPGEAKGATTLLDRYNACMHRELGKAKARVDGIGALAGVEVFSLNDDMLRRAVELRKEYERLKPFDEAILAGILVRARELREAGEKDEFYLCELDGDMSPWDRKGQPRRVLADLYRACRLEFRGDFSIDER